MANDLSVKVLIGCCAITYDELGFVPSLLKLVQEWDGKNPLVFHPRWRRPLHLGEKECVEYALADGFTHILLLEDDTTNIPDGALHRLLSWNKGVVGAYVYSRHFPHNPNVFLKQNCEVGWLEGEPQAPIYVMPNGGLRKVDMLPFQFTLINLEVFQAINKPWFWYGRSGSTDTWFADKCFNAGIDLWCDTDLIVQHAGLDGSTVGFEVWKKQLSAYSGGTWNPRSSVPLCQFVGLKCTVEGDENVFSKMPSM